MTLLEAANAAFRFSLELCGMASLGYWGFRASDYLLLQLLLGLGGPLFFAMFWGAFIGPKAPNRLDDPQRLMVEATLFGLAVIALIAAEASVLALLLASAAALNIALMLLLGQRRQGGI